MGVGGYCGSAGLPDSSGLPRMSRAGLAVIVVVLPVAEGKPRGSGEDLPPRENLPRSLVHQWTSSPAGTFSPVPVQASRCFMVVLGEFLVWLNRITQISSGPSFHCYISSLPDAARGTDNDCAYRDNRGEAPRQWKILTPHGRATGRKGRMA